jgi:tRNA threonylcarbamoyladenosine biosynthesis protein TsaE
MKEPFIVKEIDLHSMARKIVDTLADVPSSRAKVIFLEGDLGAGKTTFAKELAEVLGITKDDVHSPTFILKKEYTTAHPVFKKLIHVDAYRFDEPKEARVLNLDRDIKEDGALIVVGGAACNTLGFAVVSFGHRRMIERFIWRRKHTSGGC